MPKCKLCNENEADQTGSHIITASILKNIFDEKSRGRDYETAFTLSSNEFVEKYIGRSVPPEEIEETLGRMLTDEEVNENLNPITFDYFLCRSCEQRIKIVENYFILNVHKKLNIIKDNITSVYKLPKSVDKKLVRLFWYSIIWRVSATKFSGFQLKPKEEEKLRKILNNSLGNNLNSTKSFVAKNNSSIDELPIIIIRSVNNPNPTGNVIFLHPKYRMPYSCVFNEYVVLLYFKESHTRSTTQSFFKLGELIGIEEIINYKKNDFKIGLVKINKWNTFIKNINSFLVDKYLSHAKWLFKEIHKKITRNYPGDEITGRFIKNLVGLKKKPTDKYDKKSFAQAMRITFKEFWKK